MSEHAVFDVGGPLPSGITVLEASAGTGKTFTIAALAARYVAGGLPLDQLLLVTFTRMATGELRERVRERLVSAERGLGRVLAGAEPPADDTIVALLATGTAREIEQRRRHLAVGLADFDAATISTTHGFCQHVLSGLGVVGDVAADVTLIEDATDLLEEVVDDLYVRKFSKGGKAPFTRSDAFLIAKAAVEHPLAPIEPTADTNDALVLRQRLALAARDELDRRKRCLDIITYDDLLTRLAETLRDERRGPAACARLRERYRVVLVDEFQDTDPIQWEIMQRAFGAEGSTLVLIGDPKQAIYAFRGADVYAYLDAAEAADSRSTLAVNWRSDQGLLEAYNALFGGAKLGHPDIGYRPVHAAPANVAPRLEGMPIATPLRVRVVDRADGLVALTPRDGAVAAPSGRAHVADDVAADIVGVLSARPHIIARDPSGAETSREVLRPGHVAVLVRTNRQAADIRAALQGVRVPAVINGAGSVFATPVARDWLALLEALERPSSPARVHAVALTCFIDWDAERIAAADEVAWEQVHARVHRWATMLRQRGVASLLELISHTEGLPGRVLARQGGERQLTDLRHVAQLLHLEALEQQLGITALTAWLREQIAAAHHDSGAEDRSRRLESDAEAVQVLTIHRSKGLEFPVVYYPYLWDGGYFDDHKPVLFHDPAHGHRPTVDVAMSGRVFRQHVALALEEQRGEDLRLAYVALTRAQHQAIVWWASSWDSDRSPLGRLLFARDADGNVAADGAGIPHEDEVVAFFEQLDAVAPDRITIERAVGADGLTWEDQITGAPPLSVQRFARSVDLTWRRTSYTGITAAAHDVVTVGSEPEDSGLTDEDMPDDIGNEVAPVEAGADDHLRSVSLPLAAMPGGAGVGSLVHAVFEHVDFTVDDLDSALADQIAAESWRRIDLGDVAVVVEGLRTAIETPLGPLVDDVALRVIGGSDRLDELSFELPLVGGDQPTAELTLGALARLFDEHLPSDDPLAGYGDRLRDPVLAHELRGYLVGSIDTVLRTTAADGTPRFTVVDHKTNWLGTDGEELTAWHYRPVALADAMQRAHYPLQAAIYSVAVHRYLRWRLPGYDPLRHLAGALYLFIRGMAGPEAPRVDDQPCGVFAWRTPSSLVVALSDLFDRGDAR